MTNPDIKTRTSLPDEMRILLGAYPREAWPDHPGFAQSIENWLGAHEMFRKLGKLVRELSESYIEKQRDSEDFSGRISYYGNALVANLHGHHTWEDRKFFPELLAADDRFDHGLEMLESDHQTLDVTIETLTRQANRTLKLLQLDETQAREEAKLLRDSSAAIEGFLKRHLTDEEELVVPILLHHQMRG